MSAAHMNLVPGHWQLPLRQSPPPPFEGRRPPFEGEPRRQPGAFWPEVMIFCIGFRLFWGQNVHFRVLKIAASENLTQSDLELRIFYGLSNFLMLRKAVPCLSNVGSKPEPLSVPNPLELRGTLL